MDNNSIKVNVLNKSLKKRNQNRELKNKSMKYFFGILFLLTASMTVYAQPFQVKSPISNKQVPIWHLLMDKKLALIN